MKNILPYKNEIVSVVLVVCFAFLVNYRISTTNMQMRSLHQHREDLSKKESLTKEWRQVKDQYDQVIDGLLFKDAMLFKRFVQEQAWDYRVDISALRSAQRKEDPYNFVTISLECKGTYKNTVQFIAALEKRNIDIRAFQMKGIEKEKETTLTLETFVSGDDD
ncbi:MAG: hypothetical protein GY858_01665 [Candidatus Omnitrophica bacterium]|nr:hypothetical protein [Candidatus Omnitrophota bacterium]